jgi:hypothetical protein
MPKRVLTEEERQLKGPLQVDRWLRSRAYGVLEDEYFITLDGMAREISARDEDGDLDPQVLRRMCAVLLSADGTFKDWFHKELSGSELLTQAGGWQQLYLIVAGAIVERYLRQERDIHVDARYLMTSEELSGEVAAAVDLALARVSHIEEIGRRAGLTVFRSEAIPSVTDDMIREIIEILADEVLVGAETESDLGIPAWEKEKEIGKRALLNLRLTELRQVARERRLPTSGRIDEIADRIVRSLGIDRREIARTIIQHEQPRPERGLVSRLLPLDETPELSRVRERIEPYVGRYIRIGVARWLVIADVETAADHVDVVGQVRYYRVEPKVDEEDFSLMDSLRRSEVRIRFRRGVQWCELGLKRAGDARGLGYAIKRLFDIAPRATLPLNVHPEEGDLVAWDVRTVFMLDLLQSGLQDRQHAITNMTVVQFESDEDQERRVNVTSVRLQGQQLISSRQACEFIVQGRGMIMITLRLRAQISRDEFVTIPLRIDLHDDSVVVSTALTDVPDAVTQQVHGHVVERVRATVESGIRNMPGLVSLANQVVQRSTDLRPTEEPDILVVEEIRDAGGDIGDEEAS